MEVENGTIMTPSVGLVVTNLHNPERMVGLQDLAYRRHDKPCLVFVGRGRLDLVQPRQSLRA
jgi:hypothetical protein